MNGISSRLGGITALLFPILIAIGATMAFDQPDNDAPDQEWIDYVNDDGKLVRAIVGGYLIIIAALLFLVFLVIMYQRLRAANADATWSMVALVAGVAYSVCVMVGVIGVIVIAGGQKLGSATPATADISRWLPQLGFGVILLSGGMAAALMLAVMNTLILRTGILPAWIGYFGYLAAIGMVAAAIFIPMLVFFLYMLVVGIVLLVKGDGAPAMAAA
jgi:uncharacterized membrane protein YhaH (DUF805 family)